MFLLNIFYFILAKDGHSRLSAHMIIMFQTYIYTMRNRRNLQGK